MFKKLRLAVVALAVWLVGASAFADELYGTCKRSDDSKVDGTARITTSWNNKEAVPKDGEYRLDFGGKVEKKITVYVDGKKYTTIFVKGQTRLDIGIKYQTPRSRRSACCQIAR